MTIASNLGFPPLGAARELKRATEGYWSGKVTRAQLLGTGAELRRRHWELQRDIGLDRIPVNDFSFYDRMLDTCALVGAVPPRYGWKGGEVDLDTYFAMARGSQGRGRDVPAMAMAKWFDTYYRYIVPELERRQSVKLSSQKPVAEFREATALGIEATPVLIGPVTFLLLAKTKGESFDRLSLLDALLPVYAETLETLASVGAAWVQLDEPMLALDPSEAERAAFLKAYKQLAQRSRKSQLLVATYFASLGDNLATALALPVQGLHVDLVRAPAQLDPLLAAWPKRAGRVLSAGVIDGRNVWRADLEKQAALVERATAKVGKDRLWVAPSCSLLHTPFDLDLETKLDPELKSWLAFSKQKLQEVVALAKADRTAIESSSRAAKSRRASTRINNAAVQRRAGSVTERDRVRREPFAVRRKSQVDLPPYPTTTIGSFPQTTEVRAARRKLNDNQLSADEYDRFIKAQIGKTIALQEEIGLDVLVHGEFERNDMVEYFGEQLAGFAFTQHGWVQSYGSRAVKPPVIFGDVWRPKPMTVSWSSYAQSLTSHPMKGMLTGPVTMLQWSFVRDDQPRALTCRQIALAIRDEVEDLEKAGVKIIQIDEPAIREGLPLRREDWGEYFNWAVETFRLASSGVRDETQIHTHMCYSEFQDILDSIAAMDADVLSVEASRSRMELLSAFIGFKYPNAIGPGVYDIHSPRVPKVKEIEDLLRRAAEVLDPAQIWVNPDCGLKTRGWKEVLPSLTAMVLAAALIRRDLQARAGVFGAL